jgi:pyruvate/2-oxoglutarate dehydrogenase complex dihydrolipoamide acyltransferase (E2) component
MNRPETQNEESYTVLPFPRMRQLVMDAGWLGRRKHMIHGFIEVDVTLPRCLIEERSRQNGRKLSFSAFILACIGQAVAQDKRIHAMRDWRNRLIIFDDVDALIAVEIPAGESTFPLLHPIRAINRRSADDIHNEIRAIQSRPEQSTEMQSLFLRWFCWLPAFGRHLLYRLVEVSPHLRKKYSGTIGMTSLGMFGKGGGWGLGMPTHSLAIALGGIVEKPEMVDGRIQPRQYLHVTLSFDHDIIDGAPAARFTNTFKQLVESGFGLT